MTPKRPKQLKWTGAMLPDGRPARHLEAYGLPARDLTPDETDALSQEQLALARQHPDLYREVAQPTSKAKPRDTRPDGAETVRGADTTDESDMAGTSATDAHSGEEG